MSLVLGVKAVNIEYKVHSTKKYDVTDLHRSFKSRPNLCNLEELSAWIQSMYDDNDGYNAIAYKDAIFHAIKNNDINALEYLWQGVYYNDRDNPDYTDELYIAARHGNLTTWLHVLYAHQHYRVLEDNIPIDFEKLQKKASKNPDVVKWLQTNKDDIIRYIEECTNDAE